MKQALSIISPSFDKVKHMRETLLIIKNVFMYENKMLEDGYSDLIANDKKLLENKCLLVEYFSYISKYILKFSKENASDKKLINSLIDDVTTIKSMAEKNCALHRQELARRVRLINSIISMTNMPCERELHHVTH